MSYFCLGKANNGSLKHRSHRSSVKFMVFISTFCNTVLKYCLLLWGQTLVLPSSEEAIGVT